jgi:acyl-homoserine lactone synthase
MVFIVNAENRWKFTAHLVRMHQQRKSVFVDELRWAIPLYEELEVDEYDREDTLYLLALNNSGTEVLASARLMPTTHPHLMSDVFPHLCTEPRPQGHDVWEASRFCASPGLTRRQRLHLLWQILCAITETSLLYGVRQIIFTANSALLPLTLQCGWRARTLGPTEPDGRDFVTAVAACMETQGLETLRKRFGVPAPITRLMPAAQSIAA